MGRANALHSFPAFLVLEGPSHLPLLFSPGLSPTSLGPTQPKGDLRGHRIRPKSQEHFPGRLGRGNAGPAPPDPSSRGFLQAWEPLPHLSHPSGHQSCPASTSPPLSFPHVLPVLLGVLPISLGIRVPHQPPAGALIMGRHELCVFPHCHLDSTLPVKCFRNV